MLSGWLGGIAKKIHGNLLSRAEIDEEFDAHLAMESKILQDRGLSREQADLCARRSFGNRSRLAEETREAWIGFGWIVYRKTCDMPSEPFCTIALLLWPRFSRLRSA